MKKALIGSIVAVSLLLFVFVSPGKAQKTNKPGGPAGKPEIVYVTDFELDTGDVSQEGRVLRRPRVMQQDPGSKAANLVELLSASLTGELNDKSIRARRLYPGQGIPDRGWVVKGQFLEVGEGNRMRRAMVGFGSGATDMQIEVALFDLSKKTNEPFLVFGTQSSSGKGPGAVVTMNPYVAAAKFVLSKGAPEKDVKKTARQIAAVIARYIQDSGSSPK